MVLLSESCRGGVFSLLPDINKVLFLHHDIDRPVTLPNTQLCMNVFPSGRSWKALTGSKSSSLTNNEDKKTS